MAKLQATLFNVKNNAYLKGALKMAVNRVQGQRKKQSK